MRETKIFGKYANAIYYGNNVQNEAIKQVKALCDSPVADKSEIKIMPCVHPGKYCPTGIVMTITDKIIPYIAGVDIGCGVYTVNLGKVNIDLAKFDREAQHIPSGFDRWFDWYPNDMYTNGPFPYADLYCFKKLKYFSRIERTLGTLGGNGHFIEIDEGNDGSKYLIVHSGSRNLGKQVSEIYQQLAIDCCRGLGDKKDLKEDIIMRYKASGREQEIQTAFDMLYKEYSTRQPILPENLCYLEGKYMQYYLHDMEICQAFAKKNREVIVKILMQLTGLTCDQGFHTIHNYIDMQEKIMRKGAISAHKGEKVMIPVNMRDGCILGIGKGNIEMNFSASHGAGRLMSPYVAKHTFSIEDFKNAMQNIYSTSICESKIGEAPMAYNSLDNTLEAIKDSVEVIDILKPIYNFKKPYSFQWIG